jgi:hypothetical protein
MLDNPKYNLPIQLKITSSILNNNTLNAPDIAPHTAKLSQNGIMLSFSAQGVKRPAQ